MAMLRRVDAECAAVVAYGALLREPALSMWRHGWVNLHFSLLPAWRGAAPVQHALMAGENVTGASTFRIEHGLDTGPVYGMMTQRIEPTDTAGDLLHRLADGGAALLVATLDAIADGSAVPVAQSPDGVSWAPTLGSADARIDWRLPAHVVDARIRGLTPAPGAWTTHDGDRFKLGPVRPCPRGPHLPPGAVEVTDDGVCVGTGTASVSLAQIAPPGKAWMDATAWARGARLSQHWSFENGQENHDA